jgi:hypothetical protein
MPTGMQGQRGYVGSVRGVGINPSRIDRQDKTQTGALTKKRDAAKAEAERLASIEAEKQKHRDEASAQADRHCLVGKERAVFISTYIQQVRKHQKESAHNDALLDAYQASKKAA